MEDAKIQLNRVAKEQLILSFMKQLINKLFGAEMFAGVKNINGKKSNGVEDEVGWQHWKKEHQTDSTSVVY